MRVQGKSLTGDERRRQADFQGQRETLTVLALAFGNVPMVSRLFALTAALLFVGVLSRSGLLASVVTGFIFHSWVFFPITTKLSAWWAADFLPVLMIYAALVIYAFYTSLAGQPLLRGKLLED